MENWVLLKAIVLHLYDLLIFLLGVYGVLVFSWLQGAIASCNKTVFGIVGIVATYTVLTYFRRKLL